MENDYQFVPIKDHENLLRDPVSNGIVNINDNEYDEYISRRDAAKEQHSGAWLEVEAWVNAGNTITDLS